MACVKQVYNTDVLKFTIFCFFSDKILQHYKYVSARMVTVALDKQKFPLPQNNSLKQQTKKSSKISKKKSTKISLFFLWTNVTIY